MRKRRGRTAYTEEFWREAVRLVECDARVAREFGVHPERLRAWWRRARAGLGGPHPARVLTLEEENRRLRQENARLAEERDILKKRRPSSPGMRDEVRVHPSARPHLPNRRDVSGAGGVGGRLLRVACAAAVCAGGGSVRASVPGFPAHDA